MDAAVMEQQQQQRLKQRRQSGSSGSDKENCGLDEQRVSEAFDAMMEEMQVSHGVRHGVMSLSVDVKANLLASPRSPTKNRFRAAAAAPPPPPLPGFSVDGARRYVKSAPSLSNLQRLKLLLRSEAVEWVEEYIRIGGWARLVVEVERRLDAHTGSEEEMQHLGAALQCLKAASTTTKMGREQLRSPSCCETLVQQLAAAIKERRYPIDFEVKRTMIELIAQCDEQVVMRCMAGDRIRSRSLHCVTQQQQQQQKYRLWCDEIRGVCKSTCWIFQHDKNSVEGIEGEPSTKIARSMKYIPAGFFGGIEWESMSYIAAHLALINTLLESLDKEGEAGVAERNALRRDFAASGLEDIMGSYLRRSNPAFYVNMWDELHKWVRNAKTDGWDVQAVQNGPAPSPVKEQRESRRKRKRSLELLPPLKF